MAKKGERPTAKHIMEYLEENKGFAIRFMYIYRALRKKGYRHNYTSVTDNLKYLIEQGKIVKIKNKVRPVFYGIPKKREDGSTYIIAKKVYVENKIVELE